MANDALHANPTVAQIDINTAASDWLWAVFASKHLIFASFMVPTELTQEFTVMLLSDLGFIFMAFKLPVGSRVFYQIPVMLLTTASIAYFCMASDLGAVPIIVEFTRGFTIGGTAPTRSIWVCLSISFVYRTNSQ